MVKFIASRIGKVKKEANQIMEFLIGGKPHKFPEILVGLVCFGFVMFVFFYNMNLQYDPQTRHYTYIGVSFLLSMFIVSIVNEINGTFAGVLFILSCVYHGLSLTKNMILKKTSP